MTVIDRWVKSQELPPGHIEKKKAKQAVNEEYERCREFEKESWENLLTKKERKRKRLNYLTWGQAEKLVQFLTKLFVVKECRMDIKYKRGAAAFYKNRTIYFPAFGKIQTKVLIHEYAHHLFRQERMTGPPHGQEFLFCLDMIYQALKETRILQEIIGEEKVGSSGVPLGM